MYEVLHLAESYLPETFGMARRMSCLQEQIRIPAHYIVSSRRISGAQLATEEQVTEKAFVTRVDVAIPTLIRKAQLGLLYQMTRNRKKLAETALQKHFPYKLIHGHQGPAFALAAYTIARQLGLPFIYEEHMPLVDFARKLGRPVMERLRSFLLRAADVIITQTMRAKQDILARYAIAPGKIEVITNGVDSAYFEYERHREAGQTLRRQIAGENVRIAAYMGFLDGEFNGVDHILALAQDKEVQSENVRFVFIGEGPLKEQILRLAETAPNICYLPPVGASEVGPLYAMADIFLLTRPYNVTTDILFPLKLLEAMSIGNIVIGSDLGSFREVIAHGENGFIFGRSSGLSLKECFFKALCADQRGFGLQARQTILQRFSWERSAQQLEAIYRTFLPEQDTCRRYA